MIERDLVAVRQECVSAYWCDTSRLGADHVRYGVVPRARERGRAGQDSGYI